MLSIFSCPKLSPQDALCPRPKQEARWKAPPIVRVCSNNPKDWERVDHALNFWRALGHEFGTVTQGDTTEWCLGSNMIFSIVIKEEIFYDTRTYGVTLSKTMGSAMVGATVTIRQDHFQDPHILEHELGHPLGYKHINCTGHLMHRYTEDIGINEKGLNNEKTEAIRFLLRDNPEKKITRLTQCISQDPLSPQH